MSDHWNDCWRLHFACALARIAELEAEVGRLRLEHARLLRDIGRPFPNPVKVGAADVYLFDTRSGPVPPTWEAAPPPCHDPIEPPVVSHGPTWAYHADDPPSVTP